MKQGTSRSILRSAPWIARLGALAGAAGAAHGQLSLYSNGGGSREDPGLSTGMVTENDTVAPPGALWSEVPSDGLGNANTVAGFAGHAVGTGGYRFADDFTVTDPTGWRALMVSFFVFEVGTPPTNPPVSGISLRIWSGRPGDPGSTVLFGDVSTNRLAVGSATALYRVFNSSVAPQPIAPDLARPLWQFDADLGGLVLGPGTYWLDWQFTAANPAAAVFSPPVTLFGSRGKPGANARQFRAATGAWSDVIDPGKPASGTDVPQDLPFILRGGVMPRPCIADVNADGFVDGIDYDQFMAAFEAGRAAADVNGDGYVDGIDFDQFTTSFEHGC